MGFWILAALAAVFIIIALGFALWSPARATSEATADYDMRIYRDQLAELERDLARGVIAQDEAERSRVEISRRLLEADRAAQKATGGTPAPFAANLTIIGLLAALLLGGGYATYAHYGAPGYWDMPLQGRKDAARSLRESRPSQAETEEGFPAWSAPSPGTDPEYAQLVDRLRLAVSKRPDDPEGLTLLASHEAALGNFRGAYSAQSKLIEVKGDAVTAEDYAQLGEYLVLAARGYVSPEAERALSQALQIDSNEALARYYSGLMLAQTGRPDLAFPLWRGLLETSPIEAPWVPVIREQIEELAWLAGVNYELPPAISTALPGPSAEDVSNAQNMTAEERAAMIQSMVDGLSERLATEGGTPAEWARLISVLSVQGNLEKAAAIWDEARSVFAQAPAELSLVREAAVAAGVAE
ncbi:MAG: c-type cytochrome biogenesis protein CcmI [Maritimibacter sp.]